MLAQLLRNPPAQPVAQASAAKTAAPARPESDWQEMLRTAQFYLLWLLMVLSVSAGMMIITQVAVIASEQANWVWGFVPVATLAIFNTFGRLLAGALSDRIGRTRTMTLAFLLQAANMLAFSHYTTPALVVFGSAFTGICYGASLYTDARCDGGFLRRPQSWCQLWFGVHRFRHRGRGRPASGRGH